MNKKINHQPKKQHKIKRAGWNLKKKTTGGGNTNERLRSSEEIKDIIREIYDNFGVSYSISANSIYSLHYQDGSWQLACDGFVNAIHLLNKKKVIHSHKIKIFSEMDESFKARVHLSQTSGYSSKAGPGASRARQNPQLSGPPRAQKSPAAAAEGIRVQGGPDRSGQGQLDRGE